MKIETINGIICLIERGENTGVVFSEDEAAYLLRNGEHIKWGELQEILQKAGGKRLGILKAFRRKRREEEHQCVFCPNPAGSTRDHIPPKSCFAEPYPANIFTVPCCENCRVLDAANDAFNKCLLSSLASTEPHVSIVTQIAEANKRGYDKDNTLADRLCALIVETQDGKAFNMDNPELNRFIERITRGILYDALKLTFFPASCVWKLQNTALGIYKNPPPGCIVKDVGDTFCYLIPPVERTQSCGVIFKFYNGFYVISELFKL